MIRGLLLACLVWLLAGCGSTRLVQQSTRTSDSTTVASSKEELKSDSSFYRQTVKEKKLPGSSVEGVYTQGQLDSTVAALKAMPTHVTRAIYLQDKSAQTRLQILVDSIGRIHLKCQTLERTYYETSVEQGRVIASKEKDLLERDRTIKELREQIRQHEDSWFVKLGKFFKDGIWFVILILLGGIVIYCTIRLR